MGALWLRTVLARLFCLLLVLQLAFAASPKITRHEFPNTPQEAVYFDDSDVVLVTDEIAGVVYRSEDAGLTWNAIEDLGKSEVIVVITNPFDNEVAVALGQKSRHWITKDRGEHWHMFELKDAIPSFIGAPPLSFHSEDNGRIIMNTRTREAMQSIYTTDGFESYKPLREDSIRCLWAKEQSRFTVGDQEHDHSRILCVVTGKYSKTSDSQRLVISDSFYKDEYEPDLDGGRAVQGIVSVVAAKGFMLAARQTSGTSEMALYVTTDTKSWHRANFGEHQLKEGGYTIMESTNYSLQVDVNTGSFDTPPVGALFTSNSHGYNFVKNEEATNRNREGFVDFEKVTNIQGIVLVNVVDNVKAVRETGAFKKLKTQISFDDGRTFTDVKAGDQNLHLHSVTDANNVGRVFSSPAPGIVMGIGNTGDGLREYAEGDLWVSDDAGRTWTKAVEGAHKYEIGDSGSVLVAVYDESETGKISYSTNHGKDWTDVLFKDQDLDENIRARSLTTFPDSTGLKFLLRATTGSGSAMKNWIYTIDFSKLDKRICGSDDFERWNAVVDSEGKSQCVMGHVQSFRRRKANADCFVGEKFKDPEPQYDSENCKCSLVDYECDAGFKRSEDRKKCIPMEPRRPKDGQCKEGEKTFKDTNGFRLIPGNQCKRGDGESIDGETERDCAESSIPSNGEITHAFTEFDGGEFREYFYLERSATSNDDLFGFPDETIVVGTYEKDSKSKNRVYITHDHGKKWRQILENEGEIYAIYPHRYFNDRVYFIGASSTVHYSASRGKSLSSFAAPAKPNNVGLQIMRFHPKHEEWLIWTSCADQTSSCTPQTHVTKKNGAEWISLLKAVRDCEFVWRDGRKTKEELVYCAQHLNEDVESRLQLLASDNWFDTKETRFDDIINFATMSEFIIVAAKEGKESQYLQVDASIDGVHFADAKFPSNLQVHHSTAYTVLDSSTHSIFLHVTVSAARDQEFGTIIKSNSNGTSYTMSLSNVNRDAKGYVDFEKLLGLEGVAVANVVANADAVKDGVPKKLQTKITHNDGAQWDFIKAPETDADGKKYECIGKGPEKCSLHLHSYTERTDPRDTYSSASAIGFMLGVGNVGEFLGPKREGNTFMSTDGGISWRTAKNGQYMWEFGDQGSIVVIVQEAIATNAVYYSRDEGRTWKEYKFSEYDMVIDDITTVPSDTSTNFLLWGTSRNRKAATINLDFSGLTTTKCKLLDPSDPKSDYTVFEPKHPFQEGNCLFGHVWQYYRKKPAADCYNGARLDDGALFKQVQNCTCTRSDFECDYNYERTNDGSCKLVSGLHPISADEFCANHPDAITFYNPTGYRRIPLTTCQGGMQMDQSSDSQPCKGHEDEYKKQHGISGVGLFFAIVLPIVAAVAIGWWIYTKFEGQFGMGRIRLGDVGSSPRSARGGGDWTKYPVMAVSACAAVILSIPMVAGVAFRKVRDLMPGRGRRGYGYGTSPYTSRSSFARGRDYTSVGGQDESDLLGEDSDEDA